MSRIPPVPAREGSARSATHVRFEDVAEDGRMLVEALATGVNDTLWRGAFAGHPILTHAIPSGVIPILTRFVVEAGEGPFDPDGSFDSDGSFALAHGVDAKGEVTRIYLNAWLDTYAPIGRTNLAPPANAGERAVVGRTFSEHVFTRPFGPPSERRVNRLDLPGLPAIPPIVHHSVPLDEALAVPSGATILVGPVLDPMPFVFGRRHTDGNQHVNSLVYPRIFEESAVRTIASLGRSTAEVLARTLDVHYRKPSFAGEAVRFGLTIHETDGVLGAVGGLYAADEIERVGLGSANPRCVVRLMF